MSQRSSRHRHPAFTLIELLVVVAIIGILLAIVAGVGVRVLRNQEESATRSVLLTLDRALDEYIAVAGGVPKYNPAAFRGVPGPDNDPNVGQVGGRPAPFVVFPASATAPQPLRPDTSVFIRQGTGTGEFDAIIRAIPELFLQTTVIEGGNDVERDGTPSVVDSWAIDQATWGQEGTGAGGQERFRVARQQLVYYVHPANEAAQAVYGKCVNGRPYFMSAGRDKHYGLPEEGPDIVNTLKITLRGNEQENSPSFQQRVLRATRENNIYSYTVDQSFDVAQELMSRWDDGSGGGN